MALLIQGAQAILCMSGNTVLGKWGWKLFARKGDRNTAVASVARKLVVQVWHLFPEIRQPFWRPIKAIPSNFRNLL